MILIAPLMVDARHVNIGIAGERVGHGFGQQVVVDGLRISRRRQLSEVGCRNWADATFRDDIARKLLAGYDSCCGTSWSNDGGNVDVVACASCPVGKIAAPLRNRWNRQRGGVRAASLVVRLPIEIEKAAVPACVQFRNFDWTAKVCVKVVLF